MLKYIHGILYLESYELDTQVSRLEPDTRNYVSEHSLDDRNDLF